MYHLIRRPFSCRRGSLTIRGLEFRASEDPLPAAVVCHGFMANRLTTQGYARFLAKQGYAAFCFDFCGGSVFGNSSDGRTGNMSVLTETEDLTAVVQAVRRRPDVLEEHTLLMGCSQGGLVCALAAPEIQPPVQSLVLFYPAFCIPDDARRGKMMWAHFDPRNIPRTFWCGPMKLGRQYAADVMDLDPFRQTAGFGGHVLIVQETADRIVSADYARKAAGVYADRPGRHTVSLIFIQNAGHGFAGKARKKALKALQDFVQQQNRAEPGQNS